MSERDFRMYSEVFEEIIQRDVQFGSALRKVKKAYDKVVRQALPRPPQGPPPGVPNAVAVPPPSEQPLTAAAYGPGSTELVPRATLSEVERENRALRDQMRRMRAELRKTEQQIQHCSQFAAGAASQQQAPARAAWIPRSDARSASPTVMNYGRPQPPAGAGPGLTRTQSLKAMPPARAPGPLSWTDAPGSSTKTASPGGSSSARSSTSNSSSGGASPAASSGQRQQPVMQSTAATRGSPATRRREQDLALATPKSPSVEFLALAAAARQNVNTGGRWGFVASVESSPTSSHGFSPVSLDSGMLPQRPKLAKAMRPSSVPPLNLDALKSSGSSSASSGTSGSGSRSQSKSSGDEGGYSSPAHGYYPDSDGIGGDEQAPGGAASSHAVSPFHRQQHQHPHTGGDGGCSGGASMQRAIDGSSCRGDGGMSDRPMGEGSPRLCEGMLGHSGGPAAQLTGSSTASTRAASTPPYSAAPQRTAPLPAGRYAVTDCAPQLSLRTYLTKIGSDPATM